MTTYVAAGPLVNYFFYNAPTTQDGPNIPLDGGKIYFYADEDHSIELNSYSDVFDPNNPVVNPWPLVLGAAGECPVIYLEDRFYYIEIYDKNDVFQRSISHYSAGDATGGSDNDAINYIPNGQFRLHNDLPATSDKEAGEIRAAITDVAYGGWTFERPGDSTATDFVTFERYDEFTTNPFGSPRYACRIRCTSPDSGDAYKQLAITFPDVNKFASATQEYTVGLSAIDSLDADTTVELYLIKNFGTGGSPTTETLIETFTLTPTMTAFYKAFTFGSNTGKVIGEDNDDYVKLAFRFKTDEELDLKVVDFLQESGNITTPTYPATTEREDIQKSLGGGFPIPNPDGSDLGLRPKLTKRGWEFDRSDIGKIYEGYYNEPKEGELFCDGSQYETAGYSDEGIPYSRLQAVLYDTNENIPICGTGINYFTAYQNDGNSAQLRISTNIEGSTTAISDGAVATNFTFGTIKTGATGYDFGGRVVESARFYIVTLTRGVAFAAPGAGTSGFTVTSLRNNDFLNQVVQVIPLAAAGLAGKYFLISNTTTNYYVWYTVDGVGVDPAVGGRTGIQIALLSNYSAQDVTRITAEALEGSHISRITCGAASTIAAGSYFNVSTLTVNYYVWYKKGGAGTDPAVSGKTGIEVDIDSGATAGTVSLATLQAINQKYFAVPDLRGVFLRGATQDTPTDPNSDDRWGSNSLIYGNRIGTTQLDEFMEHYHQAFTGNFIYDIGGGAEILQLMPARML